MGVSALWNLLGPAGRTDDTLCTLAEKGFRRPSIRSYRVGVDASAWIFHTVIFKFNNMDEDTIGADPQLRLLHFRLLRFMRRGISLVLVFDGLGRPDYKRGSRIYKSGDMKGLERPLKAHLDLLGIPWLVAGGEAEAELAQMNARGEIDAVLSDDGDAFVFGCQTLIRNKAVDKIVSSPSKKAKPASPAKSSPPSATPDKVDKTNVMIYEAATIHSELGMDRDGMIFFALVSGGDYHDGIVGMGEKIAGELLQRGYGTALLQILRGSEVNARERRLRDWRESVKAVLVSGELGRKHNVLATKVDASIPDPTAVDLYLNPVVNRDRQPITWDGEIDIERLTPYVARKFEWWDRKVMAHFQNTILEAHLRQQLRKTALAIDANLPRQLPSVSTMQRELGRMIVRIKDDKNRLSKDAEGALCYRVEISPTSFHAAVKRWFQVPEAYSFESSNFEQVPDVEREELTIYYSIPSKALEYCFPSVVATFREATKEKQDGLVKKELAKQARGEAKLAKQEAKEEADKVRAWRKANGLSPAKKGKQRASEEAIATKSESEEPDYPDSDGGVVQTIKMKNKRDWIGEADDGPSRGKPLRKPRIRTAPIPPLPLPSFASTSQRGLSPPSSTPLLKYSDLESPPKLHRRSSPRAAPLRATASPPHRFASVARSAGQSSTSTRSWFEDQSRTKPTLKRERKVLLLSSDGEDVPVVRRKESTYGKTQVVKGRIEIDLCSSD